MFTRKKKKKLLDIRLSIRKISCFKYFYLEFTLKLRRKFFADGCVYELTN